MRRLALYELRLGGRVARSDAYLALRNLGKKILRGGGFYK